MSIRQKITGTGVAIITPFDQTESVDYEALGRVIDFIIAGGIEYIVTLGTTGETPVLSKEEKADIIRYTLEKVNRRVPVIVGIGGNNTRAVAADMQSLPLEGALAVLSASPYYNKPSQEGIYQHYAYLAKACPKPIVLYNVPGRTGRNMTATTTLRLAELDNIAGIKEASGDLQQCMDILKDRPPHFAVVSGDDALALPQLACGMDGVISVAANAFPQSFSNMVRAGLKADLVAAKTLNDSLIEMYNLMFAENNPAGVKAYLHEMGLIENILRLPLVPLSKPLHDQVRASLTSSAVS